MTLTSLMEVRPTLEEGFRALLQENAVNAFTRQNAPESFQTIRPRVEVYCKIGSATGHRFLFEVAPGNFQLQYDTWNFEIALDCVTTPQNIEGNNLLANQYAGMVRGMASTFGQVTWTDTENFPNCLICEPLLDTTTDDNMQSDENYETTRLSFSGIVQIRTAVWNN